MRSVKSFIAAGAATLLSSAVFAADMAIAPPPYAAPVVEDFGGWYLRGDIGFSNQRVDRLNNALDSSLTSSVQDNSFNTAGIFGLGVGYRFNNWFRGRRHWTISRQFATSTAQTHRLHCWRAPSVPILITAPNPNGWSWPTPMSISVPGGASRPFIGAGVGCRADHDLGFTDAGIPIPAAGGAGLCLRRQRVEVEFCLGGARWSRL